MLKNQKEKDLQHQLQEENPDWGAWDEKEQIRITTLEIKMKKSATIFQEVDNDNEMVGRLKYEKSSLTEKLSPTVAAVESDRCYGDFLTCDRHYA